ncbi:MAG TPA: glycosyltransferase [Puia sp.]|nr:glycosyltransferase [Puia sp.]
MIKVLWLVSWYPNESDPFSGDFIKRQAEAVSVYQPLTIAYVGKYKPKFFDSLLVNKLDIFKAENLNENILYYSNSDSKKNIFSRFQSLAGYFRKHKEFIRQLRKSNGMPDIVHVQVAMKAGLIALYLKWKYKIPYVLTEHWTGYYSESADSLFKKSLLHRYFTRLILKNASLFLPVSEALGNQIKNNWIDVPFYKIPNVVNTNLFYPVISEQPHKFRFIHISSLVFQKNPGGIIRAFTELINQQIQAELVIVGPLNFSLHKMIEDSLLPKNKILYLGEISYEEVSVELRKSSALVMFSYYENLPCVILESLCAGIPVIATKVGGVSEVVSDENGILINAGDEKELLEAMTKMVRNYQAYDKIKFSKRASDLFSYETVGKEITEVYNLVLKKTIQV